MKTLSQTHYFNHHCNYDLNFCYSCHDYALSYQSMKTSLKLKTFKLNNFKSMRVNEESLTECRNCKCEAQWTFFSVLVRPQSKQIRQN